MSELQFIESSQLGIVDVSLAQYPDTMPLVRHYPLSSPQRVMLRPRARQAGGELLGSVAQPERRAARRWGVKSAFGIKLSSGTNHGGQSALSGGLPTGESIVFWKDTQGWCGSLHCGGEYVSETIGSASPEACYRSLRGRARGLRDALTKALGDGKK